MCVDYLVKWQPTVQTVCNNTIYWWLQPATWTEYKRTGGCSLDVCPSASKLNSPPQAKIWLSRNCQQVCDKILTQINGGFFSWKSHIDAVTTKVSKTIGLLRKLCHFAPWHALINVYQSLIHPYLIYGLVSCLAHLDYP